MGKSAHSQPGMVVADGDWAARERGRLSARAEVQEQRRLARRAEFEVLDKLRDVPIHHPPDYVWQLVATSSDPLEVADLLGVHPYTLGKFITSPAQAEAYAEARRIRGTLSALGARAIADDITVDPQTNRLRYDAAWKDGQVLARAEFGEKVAITGADGQALKIILSPPEDLLVAYKAKLAQAGVVVMVEQASTVEAVPAPRAAPSRHSPQPDLETEPD